LIHHFLLEAHSLAISFPQMINQRVRTLMAVRLVAAVLAMLSATALVHGQIVTATWDPSTDQVTGYHVCIGTSSLSCNVQFASVGASQTSYAFTPTGGVLYYLAISASNAAGVGPYSSEVTFSIPYFSQPPDQSTPAGVPISPLQLYVSDPGGTLNFSHSGLPPGLALNSTTGQITGSPSVAGGGWWRAATSIAMVGPI
jgi:hypothetical protein